MHRALCSIALAATLTACGSRGEPLPPLRPVAPPIPDVRVDQLGVEAIVRYMVPTPTVFIEGVEVPIEGVELLMAAERYPAMTPDLLAVALDDERQLRLRSARIAATEAGDARRQQRMAEELRVATERALAAGEEPPTLESLGYGTEETEPEDGVDAELAGESATPLTDEEILLRRVPNDYLRSWRDADLGPAIVLEAARRLDTTVDVLWDELRMPTAIVDRGEPPALPDPERVIENAERVARSVQYEGALSVEEFLTRASVVASATYEEITEELHGTHASFTYGVGIPSPGPVRTRYYFAVRAVTEARYEGAIDIVAPLAPISVPVPPAAVIATVVPAGVELSWNASPGDVWGERLSPALVEYNVYRRPLGEELPQMPLNSSPVARTTFTDAAPTWGQRYAYEVRPVNASVQTEPVFGQPSAPPPPDLTKPRREGRGTASAPVHVVDTFPPPQVRGLEATRAANRITLRWDGPSPLLVAGFRVYRHAAPAPPVLPGPRRPPASLPRYLNELAEEIEDRDLVTLADLLAEPEPEPEAAEPVQTEDLPLCPPVPTVIAGTPPPRILGAVPEVDEGRRRGGNPFVRQGWELVTATPVSDTRFIDPSAAPDTSWVFLVQAVDTAGNVGPVACVGMRKEPDQ